MTSERHPDEIVERLANTCISADRLYDDVLSALPEGADRDSKLAAIEDMLGDALGDCIATPAKTLPGILAKARALRRLLATNSDHTGTSPTATDAERFAWSLVTDLGSYVPQSEGSHTGNAFQSEQTVTEPREAFLHVVDDLSKIGLLLDAGRMAVETLNEYEQNALGELLKVASEKLDAAMASLSEAAHLPEVSAHV